MSFVVGSPFNPETCLQCSIKSTCPVGRMWRDVDQEAYEQRLAIGQHHGDLLAREADLAAGLDTTEMVEDLVKAGQRHMEVKKIFGKVALGSVLALMKPVNSHIEPDARRQELERLADELGEAPHATRTLSLLSTADLLEEWQDAISRYSRQGICGAIEIRFTDEPKDA